MSKLYLVNGQVYINWKFEIKDLLFVKGKRVR